MVSEPNMPSVDFEAWALRLNADLSSAQSELTTLRARVEELERERERRWCLTCGAVTRDDECDCTEFAENPEAQNLVNYADECARNAREQHLRAEAAESRLSEATRLAVEALEPFAKCADDRRSEDLRGGVCVAQEHLRRARTALNRLNAMKGESDG